MGGPVRTIRLTVAYDGTDYHGWARQAGTPTIQGAVEAALGRLLGRDVEVVGASRTDAGVHALGQVACFTGACPVPTDRLPMVLSGLLPPAIAAVAAADVPASFDPARHAVRKWYRYRLYLGGRAPVDTARFVWPVPYALDTAVMAAAAAQLVGTHDFTSFAAAADTRPNKVRTVHGITVSRGLSPTGSTAELGWPVGDELCVEVHGQGFVYHMVRNIVGLLVDIGRGARRVDEVPAILAARDRRAAGPTAPALGLCLQRIWYE